MSYCINARKGCDYGELHYHTNGPATIHVGEEVTGAFAALRLALETATRERDEARERWAFWEESAAMLRRINEDYIRKNVALVNDLAAEIRRAEALKATAPHVKPEDGAVREAAEPFDIECPKCHASVGCRCMVLVDHEYFYREGHHQERLAALSSPPRPGAEAPITCEEVGCPTCCPSPRAETKGDDSDAEMALRVLLHRQRKGLPLDVEKYAHIATRNASVLRADAPPADAATEAVREAADHLIGLTLEFCNGDCEDPEHVAARALRAALSTPAPAPSAKEGR